MVPVICLLALGACGPVCFLEPSNQVTIIAEDNANEFSAIAVDVVATDSDETAARLAGLTAAEYFQQRSQIRRDNPEGLSVASYELVPGQSVGPDEYVYPCGSGTLFSFASYRTPGIHRLQVSPDDDLTIRLGPTEFEVIP